MGNVHGADPNALREFHEKTNMHEVPVKEFEKIFKKHSKKNSMDLEHFNSALSDLESHGLKQISKTPLAEQLFRVFDTNKNGAIELQEFISGGGLLCSGTLEEKAEVTFRCFDLDDSGYIEENELVNMVSQSYDAAVRVALNIGSLDKMDDVTATVVDMVRDQMRTLATDVLDKLDTNQDGKLDLKEFQSFCGTVEDIRTTVNGLSGKVNIIV